MSVNLDTIVEPTAADLADVEVETGEVDWESVLTALGDGVVKVSKEAAEDFWNEDENVHDDRYDGDGIPTWSAWA